MQKAILGSRMKRYESVTDNTLTNRVPVIIRIDGKAFHSFTRGLDKPFDKVLRETMQYTAKKLCENIQGCKLAYTQSDEISLLLTDYDNIDTQSYFDYRVQKVTSVTASIATLAFNEFVSKQLNKFQATDKTLYDQWKDKEYKAMFDSRAYNVPQNDVCNYFIWRQQDCTKNSIQMIARAYFSHEQLQGLNCNQLQEKLWQEKDINFNDFPTTDKRGSTVVKSDKGWIVDNNIPIFTQDRNYIEKLVFLPESR